MDHDELLSLNCNEDYMDTECLLDQRYYEINEDELDLLPWNVHEIKVLNVERNSFYSTV